MKTPTKSEQVNLVTAAVSAHDAEWKTRLPEMRRLRNCYATKFWKGQEGSDAKTTDNTNIRVETADGAVNIESYVASLFSRSPAVEVGEDKEDPEWDPRVVQIVVNKWLGKQRAPFERASRLALIYPCAFLRVMPSKRKRKSPLQRVSIVAVTPWNVILDTNADDWESMRFVGHRYTLPLAEAKQKWGGKKFQASPENRYFEDEGGSSTRPRDRQRDDVPQDLQAVTMVEFYDLVRGKLIFWSPNYLNGSAPVEVTDIPLTDVEGEPLHPIVPLYFAYEPDKSLEGISHLARLYDQLREKNLLRSFAANAVRRDSRQYLYDLEAGLGTDELAKITAGVDGAMIGVTNLGGRALSSLIWAIPIEELSGNFNDYSRVVEMDLGRDSSLASFTRGDATKASATEVGVLAQYTASEIGRMARERDAAIEAVAALYLAHLRLEDDDMLGKVEIDGQMVGVTREGLDADYVFTALDQAGTPISKAIEQQRFVGLVELLSKLGVPKDVILKRLVRLFDLPPEFGEQAQAAQAPAPAPAPAPPPQLPGPPEVGPPNPIPPPDQGAPQIAGVPSTQALLQQALVRGQPGG